MPKKETKQKEKRKKTPPPKKNNPPPKNPQNKTKHTNNVKQFKIQQTKEHNTIVR